MAKKRSTTIQLPDDLYNKLEAIKEDFGSSHNFVIEKALRLFFAEDVKMIKKRLKKNPNK
jgi:predicted transcriptional regulator